MKINPNASKESLQQAAGVLNFVIDAIRNPKPKRDPVSAAKIDANRRNALHSTGPKTDAGKQASSRNAIKHGIYAGTFVIPEEGRSEYAAFCDTYLDQFQPEGLEEQNLVQQMIASQWRLLRLNVVEQGVWDKSRRLLRRSESDPKPGVIEIEMEIAHDPDSLQALNRVLQMQSRLTREYNRAANQLQKLQKERQPAESASPQPEAPAAEDSLNSSTSSNSSTSFCKTNPTPPANAGIDPPKSAVESPVENTAEASGRDGVPNDHAYRE